MWPAPAFVPNKLSKGSVPRTADALAGAPDPSSQAVQHPSTLNTHTHLTAGTSVTRSDRFQGRRQSWSTCYCRIEHITSARLEPYNVQDKPPRWDRMPRRSYSPIWGPAGWECLCDAVCVSGGVRHDFRRLARTVDDVSCPVSSWICVKHAQSLANSCYLVFGRLLVFAMVVAELVCLWEV